MRQPLGQLKLFLVISFLGIPAAAHANPGSVLVMAGIAHLLFGNLIIGVGEGLVIAWLFKTRVRRSIKAMIAANYFSCLVGLAIFVLPELFYPKPSPWHVTIYNFRLVQAGLLIGTFVLAIMLEWPFTAWLLRRERPKGSRILQASLLASLVAQTGSYAVLVPYYTAAGGWRVRNDFAIDRTLSFVHNDTATVYFLRDDGIYKMRPDGSRLGRVAESPLSRPYMLCVTPARGGSSLQLGLCKSWAVDAPLSSHFAPVPEDWRRSIRNGHGRTLFFPYYQQCLDLRPSPHSAWGARPNGWGAGARNRDTGKHVAITLRLPLFEWHGWSFSMLPGDLVIAEVSGQIIAFDPNSRKMGLLAMGRNPVATTADTRVIDNDIRRAVERIRAEKTLR